MVIWDQKCQIAMLIWHFEILSSLKSHCVSMLLMGRDSMLPFAPSISPPPSTPHYKKPEKLSWTDYFKAEIDRSPLSQN
jgi:hypothetical protein